MRLKSNLRFWILAVSIRLSGNMKSPKGIRATREQSIRLLHSVWLPKFPIIFKCSIKVTMKNGDIKKGCFLHTDYPKVCFLGQK